MDEWEERWDAEQARLEKENRRFRALLLRTIPMVRSDLRDPGLLQKIFSSLAEPPEEDGDD